MSYVKNQDADRMSIPELRCISKDIGYIEPPMFFIKVPRDNMIVFLQDDGVLIGFLDRLGNDKVLEIYFKHSPEFQVFESPTSIAKNKDLAEQTLTISQIGLSVEQGATDSDDEQVDSEESDIGSDHDIDTLIMCNLKMIGCSRTM